MRILEITESTLPFLAGYLAGCMDKRLGTGREWTMMVYTDMEAGKLTLSYLERLERSIRRRWPKGETSPRIADVIR